MPDGLPGEVIPVVAPLMRGSDREVGRRLHVDITPVTKVEIWKGDALRTAWIVGTDKQVVDTRSRTVRRRALAGVGIAGVAALGVAFTTGVLPALAPSQDDTAAAAPTPAPHSSASESAGSSEPVVEDSDVTPVSAGPSPALQLWRDLGVLDGSDAGLVESDGSPGLTFLDAWEQGLASVPGRAGTDEALAQAVALGEVDVDDIDLLGCPTFGILPEGLTPYTSTVTCVFEWNGSSLELYFEGGVSAGYAVQAVGRDLLSPGESDGVAAAVENPPAVPGVNADTPIALRGIGLITVGMSLREAEDAANVEFSAHGWDELGGYCYYADVVGLEEDVTFMVHSPFEGPVSDPDDGEIVRVEVHASMGSPAATKSEIGIGSSETDVYATYGDQITWDTDFYDRSVLTFVPNDPEDRAYRVRFLTDGATVNEIRAGYDQATALPEGCN